jgi:hypothetical protein
MHTYICIYIYKEVYIYQQRTGQKNAPDCKL